MTATSWSAKSHPLGLPEKRELVPRMYSVQSPWLSSSHRPALFFLTIKPTRGGAEFVGSNGLMAGTKLAPLFGGGFCPVCGPSGKSTTVGCRKEVNGTSAAFRIVDPLPDSKIATYSF